VTERTLVLIKPDGVQRLLAGRILARYEERGLKVVGLKLMRVGPRPSATTRSIARRRSSAASSSSSRRGRSSRSRWKAPTPSGSSAT